jgi:pyruvate formate lyase activating enzyme
MFYKDKCKGCGKCKVFCPNHLESCDLCGKCTVYCPVDARRVCGRTYTIDEVFEEVIKDKAFYENSGGGLTVSGGEPMAQFDFLFALLTEAKTRSLHVCMETCGFAPTENYGKIAPLVDIFLFDYKLTSPELHKKYTGQDNALILKNLRFLDQLGAKTVLRCPIIPGINDTDDHFSGIAETANSLKNIIRIDIEPYNPLGGDKHERLGEAYELSKLKHPDSAVIDRWIEKIKARTQISVAKA